MKLTYNNGETTVTVEGSQDEVFDWYKTFVHSQTACESTLDTDFVELINRKTSKEEAVNSVNNPVNDPRAGEPDKNGWMTWAATEDESCPFGLRETDKVDFIASYSKGTDVFVSSVTWCDISNDIVKFRISK